MIVKLPDDPMKVVDLLFAVREAVYHHVGYEEGCRVLPLDDCRDYWWRVVGGEVDYAERRGDVDGGEGYGAALYVQRRPANKRHLEQAVFRGARFTLVTVDTRVDGNKFAMIFDNSKEVPDSA